MRAKTCRTLLIQTTSLILFLFVSISTANANTVEYDLVIASQEINITGNTVLTMTVNGGIPGPTLFFKEGDFARIRVQNEMDVDTSIHWHGLLVPPGMDGVPNVSFPPIKPGSTFTYEFPIRQQGTYWYHSHTSLQEQSGVYGSIVIESPDKSLNVDSEHVILLSDWTNDNPDKVNRTLKRGSEWYSLQKGSSQSIFGAASLGMLGEYFGRELQRMPAMDIADVAYDRFLANGKPESIINAAGNKTLRLRIINGSASTYFYVEFAGGPMTIIAADGIDVQQFKEKRFLIAVAETYDVLIKVPATGAYEFRATAQDGSGYSTVWIGDGKNHAAAEIPKPNLYQTMGQSSLSQIFSLTPAGTMNMTDQMVESGKFDSPGMMGMDMMHMGGIQGMDAPKDMNHMQGTGAPKDMNHMQGMDASKNQTAMQKMGDTNNMHNMKEMEIKDTSKMEMNAGKSKDLKNNRTPASSGSEVSMEMSASPTAGMNKTVQSSNPDSRNGKKYSWDFGIMAADVASSGTLAIDGRDESRPWPPYPKLKAVKPTSFSSKKPVRKIRLTLDGDMERYVWFLNNKPLSESDSIRIRKGEVVQFIMINRTMMHHPMHLHGHFFRVINRQGDYSPLKHTVNVAPMSTTVIEFNANEVGDWFFHCHLLYHMKSGMARVVHYDDFTLDPQTAGLRNDLYKDPWYFWGQASILSNMSEGNIMLSNTRNILTAEWETGWQHVDNTEWEGNILWKRYVNRFFSVFAGGNQQNEEDNTNTSRGVFGIEYLLPFNIETRTWIDSDSGGRVSFERAFELTPRLSLFSEAQYDSRKKWETAIELSYMVHQSFSVISKTHSDYGFGGGIQVLF
ncbi:multicopper oxidase domain-containing protein [bacterium]|nr:multicopper oxidase domain-containing protein [bacterium]